MSFVIKALPSGSFERLYGAGEETLRAAGARRIRVDADPGFPCRVSLRDAAAGETVLLLNYTHHDHATPYRSSHAIFVREGAETASLNAGETPPAPFVSEGVRQRTRHDRRGLRRRRVVG